MNKTLFSIIWVEAVIAFLIPAGTTLDASLMAFTVAGSPMPNVPGWIVIFVGSIIAGASGLKSFLSTTVSDARDNLAGATPPAPAVKPPDKP